MTSSGTYLYSPPVSELLIEALERCGKFTTELTPEQLTSGRRSLNLVLVAWANRGVNLWTVETFTQYMPRGVAQYIAPQQIVDVLADSVTLRQYQMGAPVSVVPQFIATQGSNLVTVYGLPAQPVAGQYINIGVAVSVGGLILNSFYKVISIPGPLPTGTQFQDSSGNSMLDSSGNPMFGSDAASGGGSNPSGTGGSAIIMASMAATSGSVFVDSSGNQMTDSSGNPMGGSGGIISGGVVPQFVSTLNSNIITVNFPSHGLLTGQPFNVEVTTVVGGVMLLGPYVITYLTANSFTIQAAYPAGFAQTVSENNGLTMLATQATIQGLTQSTNPVDIVLYPLSRGDYMAIPLKYQQGRPTSFWLDRQISPEFNVWLVPDQNGPYELRYKASQQVSDADIINGQTLNVPYRFLESFTADLAAALAVKFPPDPKTGITPVALKQYAMSVWSEAADEDREKVSTYMVPDMSSYFT